MAAAAHLVAHVSVLAALSAPATVGAAAEALLASGLKQPYSAPLSEQPALSPMSGASGLQVGLARGVRLSGLAGGVLPPLPLDKGVASASTGVLALDALPLLTMLVRAWKKGWEQDGGVAL